MVRYADDFVILCRSPEDAARALALVQEWTAEAGLTLHPTKTQIVDATEDAFDFLGYRFAAGTYASPRAKSLQKLKDTIRAKTKRTSGESLTKIIDDLNRRLRGWFEYFKHSYRTTFPLLDGWIRMRLRSILRKRQGKQRTWASERSSALAECLLCQAGVVQLENCPCAGLSILFEVKPPTGEPCAGNPPARFGGGGDRNQSVLPTPMFQPRRFVRSRLKAGTSVERPLTRA